MDVVIKIPDTQVALVVEMLRKASGKTINLSSDLVEAQGNITFAWKAEDEADVAFITRALKELLLGVVRWGIRVKDTNRYRLECKKIISTVPKIKDSLPDDLTKEL